ncbi:MAG: response regulator [Magnetospirillum sp. WYHS-4]
MQVFAQSGSNSGVVLVVEDNLGDARLIRELLNSGDVQHQIHHVDDGVKAMDFLRRQGTFDASPRPDLVILDLNLPRKDGREVLAEVKGDPLLRTIPVVVLTTSEAEEDVRNCYELHANCFVTKPADFDDFNTVMRMIDEFWFGVAQRPVVLS